MQMEMEAAVRSAAAEWSAPGVCCAEILGDDGAECGDEVGGRFELLFQSFAGGGSHDGHALDTGGQNA